MLQQASGRGLSGVVTLAVDEAEGGGSGAGDTKRPREDAGVCSPWCFLSKEQARFPPKARLLETEEEASQLLQVPSGV